VRQKSTSKIIILLQIERQSAKTRHETYLLIRVSEVMIFNDFTPFTLPEVFLTTSGSYEQNETIN